MIHGVYSFTVAKINRFLIGLIYYQTWHQLHIVNEVYRMHSKESKQFNLIFSSSLDRSVGENGPDV